jgi:biopolymer transport protein TolR
VATSADITPEINVTPLVDVVLVLLIIFMVVAPRLETGAAVNLPALDNVAKKSPGQHKPLTVSVTASGLLYLEDDVLLEAELGRELRDQHAQTPERKLVIKADKAARYGVVRKLFKSCQEAGFTGIALQVGERKKGS